jgi:putative CocE/NonD family hydrolase
VAAGVTVEFDVPGRMRDGVVLRANVYRPQGGGPWPTLLTRLPYGKDVHEIARRLDPLRAARSGFMVVIQDTRGRFGSDGDWDPFVWERRDGYDSVEWAARLPGSNGRVGMYGESYLGNTTWLAAIERPPSLEAISPALTWSDPMDGLYARGGALELGLLVQWSLEQGIDHVCRREIASSERRRLVEAIIDDLDKLAETGYWALPADANPVLHRYGIPPLPSVAALQAEAVAAAPRVTGSYPAVEVPSFQIGGWYDIFLQGTLDNFDGMVKAGKEAQLVVGPWTHVAFADPVGQLGFGLRGGRYGVPAHPHGTLNEWQLEWMARHLLPDRQRSQVEAPVRIFLMGRNEWRDETRWPPPSEEQRWFLRGEGRLTLEEPDREEIVRFSYDPNDPVPTAGGNTVMAPAYPSGPFDQREVEARGDVLVFTSEPLAEDLEVTGRVSLVLHADSSAPSTDWVGRLCDVYPDGRSMNLCDGILRVAEGAGERRRYVIDLWSTSNVFLRGHRIRVHLTSSSFPRWDRNLNTGEQGAGGRQVAHQRLHLGPDGGSFLVLPKRA